jgi:hypothetical protein
VPAQDRFRGDQQPQRLAPRFRYHREQVARPFTTRRHDRATNLWPPALLSLGESWHNMHHPDPACAHHGADPRQIEISAAVIRIFERLGWATSVLWPARARLESRRRDQGQHQPAPVLQTARR